MPDMQTPNMLATPPMLDLQIHPEYKVVISIHIQSSRPTCSKAWARLWMPCAGLSPRDLLRRDGLGLLQLLRGLSSSRKLRSRSFSWLPADEEGGAVPAPATPRGFSIDVG